MAATVYARTEERNFVGKPGGKVYWPDPLNQGDSIDIVVDWTAWLGAETVSSAAWTADSGLSVGGTTTTSTTTPATVTAGATALGDTEIEVKMTTSGGQIRSMGFIFEIVNLR